jgi:transcriptional regulator of acetoin/glycerol metabolism
VEFEPRQQARNQAAGRSAVVARWHERARQLGLREQFHPDFGPVSRCELARLAEQHRSLYTHAIPVMEVLHEQILNTHSMVILTDSSGLILHALGDADFLQKADRVALRPGVSWSEVNKGTNAIGTALTDVRPTLVHGNEHFLTVNRFLTCSCSPIRDPRGHVIGALDVSSVKEGYHAHTMALVRMSTQMIENHLFVEHFSNAVRVHFHLRPEFLGTLSEGIAAFDMSGRCVGANHAAQLQLGLAPELLLTHNLPSLFGITLAALIDRLRTTTPAPLNLCLPSGVHVNARAELCVPATPLQIAAPTAAPQASTGGRDATHEGARVKGLYTLRDLETGEPAIASVIARARKVQRRDIPIMILGETGTGKEVLARAIHNESDRSAKSFVAVDCAAIPESLVEAELFGYEEGAFTGARRKGSQGKILMANGGTLFLDEIGDMPASLQTRLLRVLQERTVTPLGSNKATAVNIAVICATHRNVRELIQRGEFREDLFYRLNGLVVRLPPLRERCDMALLVERILERECEVAVRPTVSQEVLALFCQYHWPGNVRQLSNVLRTAAVMAADDGVIERHHLPEDFMEDLRSERLAARAACAAAEPVSGAGFIPAAEGSGQNSAAPPAMAAPVQPAAGSSLREVRLAAIRTALEQCAGNVSAAARLLGVSRTTVYRTLRVPRL